MSFIYNCGRFVPVKEGISDSGWKSVFFCVSTGIVLLVIVRSALKESKSEELSLTLSLLQSDLEALKKRLEKLEHLISSPVSASTDTLDLDTFQRPEKDTQAPEIKKFPLTLDATPHYKATTDISGKLIKRHNYVAN